MFKSISSSLGKADSIYIAESSPILASVLYLSLGLDCLQFILVPHELVNTAIMSEQDALAAVALVVALVALVVSAIQLLQAIFGTAEGFRRTNR